MDAECQYRTCYDAAKYGDLEELQRMHEAGKPWDELTTWRAAQYGHVDCLRYAVEHGCPLEREGCLTIPILAAAAKGHLDCLKYLHNIGLTCSEIFADNLCTLAAQNGHLECLKFLHTSGYAWDTDTTSRTRDIECLGYAIENGCPYIIEDILEYFNERFYISYDFDLHPWIRTFLFPLVESPLLNEHTNGKLYRACTEKMAKILYQKTASIDYLQDYLPLDVIVHCIQPMF